MEIAMFCKEYGWIINPEMVDFSCFLVCNHEEMSEKGWLMVGHK